MMLVGTLAFLLLQQHVLHQGVDRSALDRVQRAREQHNTSTVEDGEVINQTHVIVRGTSV